MIMRRCCIISLFVFTINNKRTKFDGRGKNREILFGFFPPYVSSECIRAYVRVSATRIDEMEVVFFFKERSIRPNCVAEEGWGGVYGAVDELINYKLFCRYNFDRCFFFFLTGRRLKILFRSLFRNSQCHATAQTNGVIYFAFPHGATALVYSRSKYRASMCRPTTAADFPFAFYRSVFFGPTHGRDNRVGTKFFIRKRRQPPPNFARVFDGP